MNVKEIVVNKILEGLEKGVVPWHQPWIGTQVNFVTQKPYRGINMLLLGKTGEYLTWNQVQTLKGTVKKGAKSELVVFYKMLDIVNDDDDVKKIPLLRYYKVFHLSDVEGIESKLEKNFVIHDIDTLQNCEDVIKGYNNKPDIEHMESNRACYIPSKDKIEMPLKKQFRSIEEYYAVLFHELSHSTGSKNRLDRLNESAGVRTKNYGKEELIAEITTAMLCTKTGIENKTIENSVAYIQSWIKAIKEDNNIIFQSASFAQKAYEHMLNINDTELKVSA